MMFGTETTTGGTQYPYGNAPYRTGAGSHDNNSPTINVTVVSTSNTSTNNVFYQEYHQNVSETFAQAFLEELARRPKPKPARERSRAAHALMVREGRRGFSTQYRPKKAHQQPKLRHVR